VAFTHDVGYTSRSNFGVVELDEMDCLVTFGYADPRDRPVAECAARVYASMRSKEGYE
jgi:hypothetical protein